ncbi:MAG: hypothetical protein ACK4YP_19110 [Myxococcota bacterium]
MLLSLVAAAWALRCNGYVHVPDPGVTEVPRNVRWLPTRELAEYDRRLEPDPGRPVRFQVGPPLRILGIRAGLLAPATTYTVRNPWNGAEARFTTTTRADRRRPEGGRLLGAIPGSFASIVLVHEAVTDESHVFPIVESWQPDGEPRDLRVSIGRTVVTTTGTREELPLLTDVGGHELERIAARTGGAPATLVLRDEMPRCGGSPPAGFDVAYPRGTHIAIRTRWMDLAGNATPWSEVVLYDYRTDAWVGAAP